MAITVKSVQSILADMIRKLTAQTDITDVSEGSVASTILEAAALQDFQNQIGVLKVLESSNLQTLVGSELDEKAIEAQIPNGIGGFGRFPAKRASGQVQILSPFTKKSTLVYIGKPTPYAGSTKVYFQDCTGWPSAGAFYLGRGTANEEGPIQYIGIENNNTFWTLTLSSTTPLVNNHSYGESAILSQGGNRQISAGTVVVAPGSSGNVPVQFTVDGSFSLVDGEDTITVPITCSVFGETGNVSVGAIKQFLSPPFTGASVSNISSITNGASAEGDEALRLRIANYIASLSRGTKQSISSSLQGLRDPISGKTITSLNIVEPTNRIDSTKIYIDDGSGLEPSYAGQDFEQLLINSSGQEIFLKTSNKPITPCIAVGVEPSPYSLRDGMYLDIILDGVPTRFEINESEYANLSSVAPSEIVRAFNGVILNGSAALGFRTANNGMTFSVFDISGRAETLQILPSELQAILGLPTHIIRPIYVYKNNELLSFKGLSAVVYSADYPWLSLTDLDLQNVRMTVDGVTQTFSINNNDMLALGRTIASAQLSDWIAVFKKKVAGVNVYQVGSKLAFASWQGLSPNGSVKIEQTTSTGAPATWIGVNKLFRASDVLESVGATPDFEINRISGELKLLNEPQLNDNVTVSSKFTRAEIQSKVAQSGLFSAGATNLGGPKIIVGVDGEFELRTLGLTGASSLTPEILSPNSTSVRLHSSDTALYTNVKLGDYIYLNTNLTAANRLPGRTNSVMKVLKKGLCTRNADQNFNLTPTTYSATDVNGFVTFTVTTTEDHKFVVGQSFQITAASLAVSVPFLASQIIGTQTVTNIISSTVFEFKVQIADVDLNEIFSPNTMNFSVSKDTFIDVETSKIEREAFFGVFSNTLIETTLGLPTVKVILPNHGFLELDSFQVTAASPLTQSAFPGLIFPFTAVIKASPAPTTDTFYIDFPVSAIASSVAGNTTIDGLNPLTPASFDLTSGMLSVFKVQNAVPQIITIPVSDYQTADILVTEINKQLIGAAAYKLSPRQIAIRSNNFDENVSKIAVLASISSATNVFTETIATSIQPHIASKKSGFIASGAPLITNTGDPTLPKDFYNTRGYLGFFTTETEILDDSDNVKIQASGNILSYPKGLQEAFITGRNENIISRVYNNDSTAPFAGFARGIDTLPPLPQTIYGTNQTRTNLSLRLNDIPLTPVDRLVVQMDLDAVNKTTSIPMYKKALTQIVQPFGSGPGNQLIFTLKDPEDKLITNEPRPFFEPNSPFRTFDFTDFNILFKPTIIHTIYPSLLAGGGNPNPSDALVIRSTQYGPVHDFRFNFAYPLEPNSSQLQFTHESFQEEDRSVLVINCTLCSGSAVLGTQYTGSYTITPSDYTSPTGAEIVKLTISALSINLSGAFLIGDILNIGGAQVYSGSFLIIETPDPDTIIVSAPGIRKTVYDPVSYVSDYAPIQSFSLAVKSIQDVITKASNYYSNNPVFTIEATSTTNTGAPIKFPTYHTHGNSTARTNLTTLNESNYYHSARAPFGCMAHIHTYSPVDNEIVALVQYDDSVLPEASEILNTGFSSVYSDQECVLIPASAKALEKWLKFTAISPLNIQSEITRVTDERNIQLNSLNLGAKGAVKITGVTANSVIAKAKNAASKQGTSIKFRTDFPLAQSFARGSFVEVYNSIAAPIYRAYRTQPSALPTDSRITAVNSPDIETWFKISTIASYTRPSPNKGRFVFRKSLSGIIGDETVEITKPTNAIAKISITAGTGVFNTKVGDMLILRGSKIVSLPYPIDYTSLFNISNQCITPTEDLVDQYIGYPVVHIENEKTIYVIAPNIVPETVSARKTTDSNTMSAIYQNTGSFTGSVKVGPLINISNFYVGDTVSISGFEKISNITRSRIIGKDASNIYVTSSRLNSTDDETNIDGIGIFRETTEFMFVPMLKNEKNIKTNYKAGAPKDLSSWKVSTDESVFYRIKPIGNGFVYVDLAFSTHDDMQLHDLSVSSDDWISFSDAFAVANRGRFKIIAHNGKNAFIIKNDEAVEEILALDEETINSDNTIGNEKWQIGPIADTDTINTQDKRHVRIWDVDSVFENDFLIVKTPNVGTTNWFDSSLIGKWPITKIGMNNEFDVFVEADIINATSASKQVVLANSKDAISFEESAPYKGYRWVSGYAHHNTIETDAELYLMPQVSAYKISPAFNTQIKGLHKLDFDSSTTVGVDAYNYYTELIAESHKVLDGLPSNTIAYPGVRAAGTSIEVLAPLIKSIQIGISVESSDGISLNTIKNPIKSAITAYINALGVGKEVVISQVIKHIQEVPGVKSVQITSTLPIANEGVIKVGSFEVPRISKPEDILL
jgi:hypothetical protein